MKYFLVRAPFRVSLLGGGTDYPEYFKDNQGAVLGFAINRYIYLGGLLTNDYVDYKYRLAYSKLETTSDLSGIEHPIVREVLLHFDVDRPIDFSFQADLPASAGLGSSSTFSVGMVQLVTSILGKQESKMNRAKIAIHIDRDILNENVGVQDHLHASFGSINRFDFNGQEINRKEIDLSHKIISKLENSMILVFTGEKRRATEIVEDQIKKTKEKILDTNLSNIYEMVDEGEKILQSASSNSIEELGALINEYWYIKRGLSKNVSNANLDKIYDDARELGAYGGKLCGAGGGGFFLFFLPNHKKSRFIDYFGIENCIDIKLDHQGTKTIFKG